MTLPRRPETDNPQQVGLHVKLSEGANLCLQLYLSSSTSHVMNNSKAASSVSAHLSRDHTSFAFAPLWKGVVKMQLRNCSERGMRML